MVEILDFHPSREKSKENFFKKLYNLFSSLDAFTKLVLLTLLVFMIVTPVLVRSLLTTTQKAQTATTYYGKSINTFGLFGQTNVGGATRNTVDGRNQYHSSGVLVDKSSTLNRVYIVDSGNSRILGFNGIGSCSNNTTFSCTVDSDCGTGNSCNVASTSANLKQADIVIGQPNMNNGMCNGDDNLGFTQNPTASSLCLLPYPYANNTAEQWGGNNIDVDSKGNLFVVDTHNNRVLEYNSPFTSGNANAVAVWGQADFTHNGRNRGPNFGTVSPPNNNTLWTGGFNCYGNAMSTGVSVDPSGNSIWVADTCNHRVLRFPIGSTTADLVIGETDFISTASDCSSGTSLTNLCGVELARVNPATGDLYVLDVTNTSPAFNSRILVFHAPFSSGMAAYKIIKANQLGPYVNWGSYDGKGTYAFQSTGFVFNTDTKDYPTGTLWVTEHDADRVLLIEDSGNIIAVIGASDQYHRGGDSAYAGCPVSIYQPYHLWWPSSSVSFDSANNLYASDEANSSGWDVVRYALPYNTYIYNGVTCLPNANGGIDQRTQPAAQTLGEKDGLTVYGTQLIALDENQQIKAWNNYQTKSLGAAADYVVNSGVVSSRISSAVDDQGRLWTIGNDCLIIVFQLPITSSTQQSLAKSIPLYWLDDGTKVTGNSCPMSFTFDKINKIMYVADSARVLRIQNYNNFATQLNVDMVLGQLNKTNTCNQGLSAPTAATLCQVPAITFDTQGNLYAVDDAYECHGNRRITVFMASDLKNATGMFPNIAAQKVFNEPNFTTAPNSGLCSYWVHDAPGTPVSVAFDSQNHMVIGNDGYYAQGYEPERPLKQLWYYSDPINKQTPDASIGLYMGTPGDLIFDSQDNLLIRDLTWYRINMINLTTDPVWLNYLSGVTPQPIVTSGSTPTPFSTSTPTPSPLPTPTPIPTATPTPIPVLTSPTPTLTPKGKGKPVYYSISGTVYVDSNQNGVEDSGEGGYNGAAVTLSGATSQTGATDSLGVYSFTNLSSGSYTVTLTVPSFYQATTTNPLSVTLGQSTTGNFGIFTSLTPPLVSITSPLNGSTVTKNVAITITAATTTGTNPISKVEFYVGSTLLCNVTSSPYSCVWKPTGKPGAVYTLSTKAYDTVGLIATSPTVTVTSK